MSGFHPIVERALVETVVNIGQLSREDCQELDKAVRKGWLSKGRGGPYPILKTVYAVPGFDFEADRQAHVDYFCRLAEFEKQNHLGPYHPIFAKQRAK